MSMNIMSRPQVRVMALLLNGTNYEETIFAQRVYDLIDNKFVKLTANTPFFMIYTPRLVLYFLCFCLHSLQKFLFSDRCWTCTTTSAKTIFINILQ